MPNESTPRLAAVLSAGNGEGDRFLTGIARALAARGVKVGGVVQSNTLEPGQCRCSMVLEELTTGALIPISQNLGREARGCRLDAGALEFAASLVETSIARGLDILVLNKFGRGEAEGRGFRTAIASAIEASTPVLIGLNRANLEAWLQFTGGDCVLLEANHQELASWLAVQAQLPAERTPSRAELAWAAECSA